jgi:hypothetical protein
MTARTRLSGVLPGSLAKADGRRGRFSRARTAAVPPPRRLHSGPGCSDPAPGRHASSEAARSPSRRPQDGSGGSERRAGERSSLRCSLRGSARLTPARPVGCGLWGKGRAATPSLVFPAGPPSEAPPRVPLAGGVDGMEPARGTQKESPGGQPIPHARRLRRVGTPGELVSGLVSARRRALAVRNAVEALTRWEASTDILTVVTMAPG